MAKLKSGTRIYGDATVDNKLQVTSGPVLVGTATSTGTASQPLQVTGGAYVSGNIGIATTNPTSTLHVVGDIKTSNQLVSTVATGTAPLSVASTTLVTNLNADLLDGLNSATANTVSTIVARDPSGNFSAGTITANLTGTASNVTTNANLTGHVTSVGNAAVLGSFTSAQLATALTDETGTGAAVFATSPTLVTPVLGTPASGNLVNCTFPTLNQNTTGTATSTTNIPNLTGAITSVNTATSLGSFTSAQLATALTDETGTGANVFATSPTLVTPILGTPTSGNLANCTFPTLNQNTTGNAATATTLATTRTIWGQNFNGGANVTGALSGATTIAASSTIQGTQLISTVATGTAPLSVTSTTVVTNLNADLLDGKNTGTSGNTIPLLDGTNTWSNTQNFSNGTGFTGLSIFNLPAGALGSNAGQVNTIQLYQPTTGTDAYLTFHISSDYAAHFGLDGTTNDLFFGGWSAGSVKNKVWHAGNDGPNSGLSADVAQTATYLNTAASSSTSDNIASRVNSGFWETSTATTAEGWPLTTNGWTHLISCTHNNTGNYYALQLAAPFASQRLFFRTPDSATTTTTTAWSEVTAFPIGTTLLFYQANAPTGWTKVTTQDNKALRVVSGTGGGTGGSTAFTTVFASKTVPLPQHGHTITDVQHSHLIYGKAENAGTGASDSNAGDGTTLNWGTSLQYTGITATNNNGTAGASMDFAVQYIDVILCSKN